MDKPTIFLNHFYIVVGTAIFKALQKSEFFTKEFANVEVKSFSSQGIGEWEGLYLRGKDTYVEFFAAHGDRKLGDYGFGFGVESKGDLDKIFDKIKEHVPESYRGIFQFDGQKYPSFNYIHFPFIQSSNSEKHIDIFVMEYTETIFKIRPKSTKNYRADDISRERYNASFWNPNAYLENITSISMETEPAVIDKFIKFLQLLFEVSAHENSLGLQVTNNTVTIDFNGFQLNLKKSSKQQSLNLTIEMNLCKRIDEKQTLVIATAEETAISHPGHNIQLTLEEKTAKLMLSQ